MRLPAVDVTPATVALGGGVDRLSTSVTARQGSADFARNYEAVFGGGFERIGGFERFSGQPAPSAATYRLSVPVSSYAGINQGDLVTGATSGATGVCVYVGVGFIGLSKTTGTLLVGETVTTGGVPRGIHGGVSYAITPDLDNQISARASDLYRADIGKLITGGGQCVGIAALGSVIYAWADSGAAMTIHRATASGWQSVDLGEYVEFSNANVSVEDADTLTQGGVTATIVRVVLESGTLLSGTNTGKLILSGRSGGNLVGGAATSTGGGALTLSAAQVTISLASGGRVLTSPWNFTASVDTRRLYGCDGQNAEFEFDGAVYVPLKTGMSTRATTVLCHKNHVFFGFRGSVQHSGIAAPYSYTAISGAAELGAGDVVTGMVSVAGSEDQAAMLVVCQDSTWALFGDSSAAWQFTPLSREAGGNAFSLEDAGHPICHDTPGVRSYKPTQNFGNFEWALDSRLVEELVRNRATRASCFTKAFSRYRIFFSDGTAVSGTPGPKGWEWAQIKYDRDITIAYSAEVAGVTRTFYADDQGWVLEADKGRSFDGDEITAVLRLHGLHQGSPMLEKTYRYGVLETSGQSPFSLMCTAEFDDGHADKAMAAAFYADLFGGGAQWDTANWNQSFWDMRRLDRQRIPIEGRGYNAVPIFLSQANDELPHQIKTVTLFHTKRRAAKQ